VDIRDAAVINETGTPEEGAPTGWSFANLILVMLSGAFTLMLAVLFVHRRPRADAYAAEAFPRENNRVLQFWIVSIFALAAAICLYVLTEDIRSPMVIFNRWTVMHAVILALQILIFSFAGSEVRSRAAANMNRL
jgi:hypothetical protein